MLATPLLEMGNRLLERHCSHQHQASQSGGVAVTAVWSLGAPTPPNTPTTPTAPFAVTPRLTDCDKGPEAARSAGQAGPGGFSTRLRSRRHRLSARPQKRLFTPAIKRMLKGWLVRRRDNPYPSRAEKEALASQTGLTYMQICNWFANWRRKLRDCGRTHCPPGHAGSPSGLPAGSPAGLQTGPPTGAPPSSWANLIRRYNARAAGPNSSTAQEHFSISSGDSIWGADDDAMSDSQSESADAGQQQNPFVSSTTNDCFERTARSEPESINGRKRTHLRRNSEASDVGRYRRNEDSNGDGSAVLLSKWLESAARYRPAPPGAPPATPAWGIVSAAVEQTLHGRQREELDAAEALTFLSSLHFR